MLATDDHSMSAVLSPGSFKDEFSNAMLDGDLAMLTMAPPIAFQRCFVDITGSVTAALMLSALYNDLSGPPSTSDGWFCASTEGWQASTGLTYKEQSTARKVLREQGILKERKVGYPASFEVKIDYEEIGRLMIRAAKKMRQARERAAAQQNSTTDAAFNPGFNTANDAGGAPMLRFH